MDRTDKLNKLLELLKDQTITPSEVEKFLGILVNTIKTAKTSFENLSAENLQKIQDCLVSIKEQHTKILGQIDSKGSEQESAFKRQIQAVEALLREVGEIKATPGYTPVKGVDYFDGHNPDPSEVVPLVLKEILPVPIDTGEIIVDKINDLEIEPEKQIDASHIKNLPKLIQNTPNIGGVRFLEQLNDVAITDKREDLTVQYDTTNNRWESGIAITVSATQPTSPKLNDLWIEVA